MFIQTEATLNPATLKFLPGCDVMERGTANFPSPEDATRSSLASGLYEIEGVTGVFSGADFITVTEADDVEWVRLKPSVLVMIMEHFTAGQPLFTDYSAVSAHASSDADDELVIRIKELLDTRVRPAVTKDGGDILFRGFDRGVVYLHMQGSCSGCPSSTATLKAGIENMLRHYIPEVIQMRAV